MQQSQIVLGDFNCCRSSEEKLRGNPIPPKFLDFNHMLLHTDLIDLSSSGLSHTWSNNRTDYPIHIKLDRALVNDLLQESFPVSYYKVDIPRSSNRSPLTVYTSSCHNLNHRFLFKNYQIKKHIFLDLLGKDGRLMLLVALSTCFILSSRQLSTS